MCQMVLSVENVENKGESGNRETNSAVMSPIFSIKIEKYIKSHCLCHH